MNNEREVIIEDATLFLERYLNKRFENQYREFEGISDNLRLKDSLRITQKNGVDYVTYNGVSFYVDLDKILRDFELLGYTINRKEKDIIELSIDYKNLDVIYKVDEILEENVLKKELK